LKNTEEKYLTFKDSAAKRQRQNVKRRLRNRIIRSKVRTQARTFIESLANKNKEKSEGLYKDFVSIIDKAVAKGVYHKNTAARKKSRLFKRLNVIK
jgi:small subunit ribosomal protein S20